MKSLFEIIALILLILVVVHWEEVSHWFSAEVHYLTVKAEAAEK